MRWYHQCRAAGDIEDREFLQGGIVEGGSSDNNPLYIVCHPSFSVNKINV